MCVRKDLQMGKGKIAAQCGHASVGAYRQGHQSDPATVDAWLTCGQPKIAVAVNDDVEMLELHTRAKAAGLPVFIVRDAGHTQVRKG